MSTAFLENDSIALSDYPRVAVTDGSDDCATLCHEQLTASQALAVYRRVMDAADALEEASLIDDRLEEQSIDELRRLAFELHVPGRSQITEKSDLIAQIRRRF